MRFFLAATLTTLSIVPSSRGAEADAKSVAFFEQKIRPVLVEHCYACHSESAKKVKGGLLLDSRAGWEKGGDSNRPAIVPGKPGESLLIESLRHVGDLAMPPKAKLPDAVIADMVTWVQMGSPDPRTGKKLEAKRADKSWWSLQPLSKAAPPPVANAEWNHNGIDRWIFAKLQANKLVPNPPANPRDLIRRMSYDVIGLPPTFEEVEAFSKAYQKDANHAVESLADRLLASPHYGERWGRHWLDVVRFGESNGFERNFVIDDLYPFRDFVIRSFNEDKPFNQFIVEHLAGDVIGKDKPETEIGSAFLVAGPFDDVGNQDAVARANIRAATLDDMITATASAFLGLTVNCARCHHHKFDPVPMEDYYRLRAAFEGVKHGRRVVASAEDRKTFTESTQPLKAELTTLESQRRKLQEEITARATKELKNRKFPRPRVDPQLTEEKFDATEARHVRMVIQAHTTDPRNGAKCRLTEFEIWSASREPRNVALASHGSRAEGERSAVADDFPEAYGPQYVIDGKFGEQWFVGDPAMLTITLPRLETINRITFTNSKGVNIEDKAQGSTPCEYEIQISLDGKTWRTVADGHDRAPWSAAHGLERVRREVTTPAESRALASLDRQIAEKQQKFDRLPKLTQVWAGIFSQPGEKTFLHQGGDPMKPGAAVPPGSLSVLGSVVKPYELATNAPEGERRLALGRWITSDDNPLTLRVLANRVWHYHFGTGLVDTPSDLGFLGSRPTHPELLDWLAGRLLTHGWRLKPMHREILLSRTYQQAATFRPDAAALDKDARLLWRFPPRRLSAEELRDTFLYAAGKLDTKMGGPGFRIYKVSQNNVSTYFPLDRHGPETYRRSVYHQNARASVVDLLSDFDFPDTAFAAPRRANTTTPLQALTLLNHSFTLDMADALAARATARNTPEESITRIYQCLFQRDPTAKERTAAEALVRQHGLPTLCRALLNANELMFVE